MANCERKDPPVFTEEVQKWDRERSQMETSWDW